MIYETLLVLFFLTWIGYYIALFFLVYITQIKKEMHNYVFFLALLFIVLTVFVGLVQWCGINAKYYR